MLHETPLEYPSSACWGLVLSGGAARGFAHLGALRVLERRGLDVQIIAGASMGAIVGAFHAAGYSADELYALARGINWREMFDFSFSSTSLFKGEKLRTFLSGHLPQSFGDLRKPLAVLATDLERGHQVTLYQGDLITALLASSCFPGAFRPISLGGRQLVDGGLLNNLPVDVARFLGADLVIASDCTVPRQAALAQDQPEGSSWIYIKETLEGRRRTPIAHVAMRSIDIMQSLIAELRHTMHPADIYIRHTMPLINVEAFHDFERIVELGEAAAERTLSKVAHLLQE